MHAVAEVVVVVVVVVVSVFVVVAEADILQQRAKKTVRSFRMSIR